MKYEEYGARCFLSIDGIWRDLEDVPLPGDPLPYPRRPVPPMFGQYGEQLTWISEDYFYGS